MSKVITIDNIEYPGYIEDEPNGYKSDISKFAYYTKIFKEDYCYIQKGTPLMYYINEKLLNSGYVLKFLEPDIFVLKNEIKMCIWSVKLGDTDVYIKNFKIIQKENKLKENLFELYNAGYIKILENPVQESPSQENIIVEK
tara:strand:+ start:754 stop:1176 length:423 start_codon:yes stop_codon:yes gene_type:complete